MASDGSPVGSKLGSNPYSTHGARFVPESVSFSAYALTIHLRWAIASASATHRLQYLLVSGSGPSGHFSQILGSIRFGTQIVVI